MLALLIAAAWNFITNIIPRSLELSSPVRPLLKLTKSIFLLSITSLKSKELSIWPMMLRIIAFDKKAPNLLTNQLTTSPNSLERWDWGISFCQNSKTFGSVTYLSFCLTYWGSLNSLGISIKLPPSGPAMTVKAAFLNKCS